MKSSSKLKPYQGSFSHPLNEGSFSLEGEALYWKPYGYIPYALKESVTLGTIPTDVRDPQVNLKAHLGFRLQLGYYIPKATWYTTAQYTQIFSSGTDFISNNGTKSGGPGVVGSQPFAPLLPLAFPVVGVSGNQEGAQASATENVRLKTVDWIIAKTFITPSHFTFDPYIGFRYARIKVGMDIEYSTTASQGDLAGQRGTSLVELQNNLIGYGLRGGFKANWKLGKGFEIFGNTSISNLVGSFYLTNRTQVNQISGNTRAQASLTDTEKYKDIYLAYQFGVGLIWGRHFKNNVYYGMKIGYEMNVWPSFLKIMRNPANSTSIDPLIFQFVNNLSFQGIIGSMKLDF